VNQAAATGAAFAAEVAGAGAMIGGRMAPDAVRSHDELVSWFDTSPMASNRTRQFMLIDLAGRLGDWCPIGRHWETVRGMLGLDLDAATPVEDVPRVRADARRRQLRGIQLYIMTP
jgi:hypothetical protein